MSDLATDLSVRIIANALSIALPVGNIFLFPRMGLGRPRQPGHGDLLAGQIEVHRNQLTWPSPEVMVRDLRSGDDQIRLLALTCLGVRDAQSHLKKWSQGPDSKVIGDEVVTPDLIRLTYARLSEDVNQQAILAVQLEQTAMTFVAVALPTKHGWERIATVDCWCKYDMGTGSEILSEFVQLRPAPIFDVNSPGEFELVIRASGGGTGIYEQQEGHFRIRDGALQQVISFTSRYRLCDPYFCKLTKRWFYSTNLDGKPGGILIEGKGKFSADDAAIYSSVRKLEDTRLHVTDCTSFAWDEQQFRYRRVESSKETCK